jgi:hypothetical protein
MCFQFIQGSRTPWESGIKLLLHATSLSTTSRAMARLTWSSCATISLHWFHISIESLRWRASVWRLPPQPPGNTAHPTTPLSYARLVMNTPLRELNVI